MERWQVKEKLPLKQYRLLVEIEQSPVVLSDRTEIGLGRKLEAKGLVKFARLGDDWLVSVTNDKQEDDDNGR
jgi:hypothetical protein